MILLLATTTLLFATPLPPASAVNAPAPLTASSQDEDKTDEPKGPDKDAIKKALEELDVAFDKDTEVPECIATIESMGEVPCKEVAHALAKGLKHKDLEIVHATLLVLAKMDVDEALKEIVGFHKRDRRLKKDEELLASTLKAIGWHGDPSAIDILSKDVFTHANRDVIRARILGLGRIRTPEAAEAVMSLLKSSGKGKIQPYMEDLNLSLSILTGADNGKSQDRWIQWWNDNKRDLEISEEPPRIDKQLQKKWDKYWGVRMEKERGKKREDRGGDDG